ncbi:MAG: Hpt domain-containing protein [Bdellovibrionales bacterium]|jgi:HPt (histidine-containing phosphotransfer) domain-containing protein|nr:Hpt domain-containing protein [Bdellovibrionales bacterium]
MSINDVLAELRKTYLDALPERANMIEKLMSESRYSEVETEFHKLKGTGKTYGLPEVTQIGEIAERLCEQGSTSAEESVPAALRVLRKVTAARTAGHPLDLENDVDFLYLMELARELHETTSGRGGRPR